MLSIEFVGLEAMQLLLDHGADVNIQNIDGNTALIRALVLNDIIKVRLLLDHGANVNIISMFGYSALTLVGPRANPRMLKLLKKYDDTRDTKPSRLL